MVVIVTGANRYFPSPALSSRLLADLPVSSGFGLGICNQVIRALSLPPGHSIPISTPQSSATPSTLRHLIPSADSPATSKSAAASTKHVPTTPPPTLTLILACRSRTNGENAREILLETHDRELKERARNGMPVREGWREGLRVVIETVDLDSVGGDNGILSFTERIKDRSVRPSLNPRWITADESKRYPHVTSLFLNAGLAAFKGNDYWKVAKQVFTAGPAIAFSHPEFNIEIPGVLTADGERGKVWGVNVLAGYILVRRRRRRRRVRRRCCPLALDTSPDPRLRWDR
jgi:3-keto steroid reductase